MSQPAPLSQRAALTVLLKHLWIPLYMGLIMTLAYVSFFAPEEFPGLARAAGFGDVRHVSGRDLNDRYFAGRPDGLRPSTGEDFLVATT